MSERRGVVVLGATGSVGRQALEILQAFPDRFRAVGLAAHRSVMAMAELVLRHRPEVVALADERAARELAERLGPRDAPRIEAGEAAIEALALHPRADVVLGAMVGRAGLRPVHAALQAGKTVALANKEALVMAGELLMETARQSGARILPVDSEHAAVHQLLRGVSRSHVRRVVLTASGGPFFGRSLAELEQVSPAEALQHPRWAMGDKVTIDSATLMNKGFEILEASHLFGLPAEQIGVLIHPRSVVHALLETVDGVMFAQLAHPDMRGPIGYALAYPDLLDWEARPAGSAAPQRARPTPLDLAALEPLAFHSAEEARTPALGLCREAIRRGGGVPAALSVADEVAVEAFLKGRIRFPAILRVLEKVLTAIPGGPIGCLDDVFAAGEVGAALARRAIQEEVVR